MRKSKKIFTFFFTFLLFCSFQVVPIQAIEFNDENEQYYAQQCNGTIKDPELKEACRLYQEHLNDKANQLIQDLQKQEEQLEELKKDIANNVKIVAEYNQKIQEIEQEIAVLETSIQEMENNIIQLNEEIETREKNVVKIDTSVKERMVTLQSFIRVNNYIEFLIV